MFKGAAIEKLEMGEAEMPPVFAGQVGRETRNIRGHRHQETSRVHPTVDLPQHACGIEHMFDDIEQSNDIILGSLRKGIERTAEKLQVI